MMTETISPAESRAAESPRLPRPETDAAILNLPQLSIMISLQVSANRAQAAADRRAIADHETLIALHEMARQQLDILNGQDRVLAMLDTFASKDMPGKQREIQDCVDKILAKVDPAAAGS
jgi:hypothetical protein